MQKIDENFSIKSCKYEVTNLKEGTARIALWEKLNIPFVYTLEASMCGNKNKKNHFIIEDFRDMGNKVI